MDTKRLKNTQTRLNKKPEVKQHYQKTIESCIENGYIDRVDEKEI